MLKAKTLIKTCIFAPSQWEGITENGKSFYIRYRWGQLTLRVSKNETSDIDKAVLGDIIFEKNINNENIDVLGIKEIREYLSGIIDLSIDEQLDEINF
jgi:hypothetical protein